MRLESPSPAGIAPDLPALLRALANATGVRFYRGGRPRPARPDVLASPAAFLADLATQLADVSSLPPFQLLYETPAAIVDVEVEGAGPLQLQIGADGAFREANWHGYLAPRAPREVLSWLAEAGLPEPLARYDRWNGPEGNKAYARFVERAPPPFQPLARVVRDRPLGPEVAAAREELERGSGVGGFLRRVSGAGRAAAIKALLEWYGDAEGPLAGRPPHEELPRMALSGYGHKEVLDVLPRLTEPAALRGAGRYILVPEVSPSMLSQYAELPRETRDSLVAAWSSSPADAARLKERLFPDAWRAPAGTTPVALSQTASFRSVATRGDLIVAIDGFELVRLDGGQRRVLTMVPMPGVVSFEGDEIRLQYGGATRLLDVNGTFLRSEPSAPPSGPPASPVPPAPLVLDHDGDTTRVGWKAADGAVTWTQPLSVPRDRIRQVLLLPAGALLHLSAGAGEALVQVDRPASPEPRQ